MAKYQTLWLIPHIFGVVVISELIFGGFYRRQRFEGLASNATSTLGEVFEKIAEIFAGILPSVGDSDIFPPNFGVIGLQVAACFVAAVYTLILARKVYRALFGRMELFYPRAEIGFEFPRKKLEKGLVSKRDIANDVRRRRKIGNLPPVYPNGWFCLIYSEELSVGATTSVNAIGQNFAIFRDEEGQVHILDAYCVHLGANLAIGAKVIGKCIECPFHGWQYDGESGQCTKIPYSNGKIPSQAKVKVWPSLEVNGMICVWYDAEGRDPGWVPEEYEKIKSGRWTYRGYSTHLVNAHIEDIPENGADIEHLKYVHNAGVCAGSGADFKNLLLGKLHSHEWSINSKWEALPDPTSHIGRFSLTVMNVFFGLKISALNISVTTDQTGPGISYIAFKSILGTTLLIHTVTPQEPLLQKTSAHVYADWWIPTFVIKLVVNSFDIQLERDILVWNNKRYELKPILVSEDKLISKHRRWFSQFYSENSPRFSFNKEDLSF